MAQNKTESDYSRDNEQQNVDAFKRKYKKLQEKSQSLEEEIERLKKEIAVQRNKCLQSVSEINRIAGERLVVDQKIVIKPEFILQKNDKPKEFLYFLVKNYADMEAEEKALKAHYAMVEELIAAMKDRLGALNERIEREKQAYSDENNQLCMQCNAMKDKYQQQLVENEGIRKRIKDTKDQISQRNEEISRLKAEIQQLKPGYSKIKSCLVSRKEYEEEKKQEYARLYQELRSKAEAQEKELRKYQQRIDFLEKYKEEAQIQLSEISDNNASSSRKRK